MSLVEHAKHEMLRAGLFASDSDYDGALGPAVMELVEVLAKQGHSGFSAGRVLDIFNEVARFRTLGPITSDAEEWFDHGMMSGEHLWQNKRDGAAFSRDGGKTWYHLDDPAKCNGDVHRRPTITTGTGEEPK